jgi:hypothetical protein
MQLSSVVGEKESGLLTSLRRMGLLQSAYWTSWAAADVLLGMATALSIVVWGACARQCVRSWLARTDGWRRPQADTPTPLSSALLDPRPPPPSHPPAARTGAVMQFRFFLRNDTGLLLLLFWLFTLALSAFSYFLSVFLSRAQSATYTGFAVFLVRVPDQQGSAPPPLPLSFCCCPLLRALASDASCCLQRAAAMQTLPVASDGCLCILTHAPLMPLPRTLTDRQ